jgi:hypothetical protein
MSKASPAREQCLVIYLLSAAEIANSALPHVTWRHCGLLRSPT